MPALARSLALGVLAALSLTAQAQAPLITLEVGGWKLEAEVAVSPQTRATGLMHRDTLPENQGMLFVNPRGHRPCMWMKETAIPLAVAFIDANGVILNMAEMQAHSLDLHCAEGESGYVLEMNADWFGKRGIGPGARLSGLNAIRR
jgi:uncharacterized membrane protein (UPF0127 family)